MSANATAKDADYLLHDTTNPGNMYAEATGLNVSGRYLRIVPLTTYTERWVELYELQINGGAYMTTESNRDIISETAEEAGKIPSNLFFLMIYLMTKPNFFQNNKLRLYFLKG